MLWPEKPTIHGPTSKYSGEIVWSPPRINKEYSVVESFRRCSYCGSIHPADLVEHLQKSATLHGADWKYGWPHKFYVEGIPNLTTDLVAKVGSNIKDGVSTDIIGKPSATCHVKFYNEHIIDVGFDDEARALLLKLLAEKGGVAFEIPDGQNLSYRAPYYNFQK